jgi:hypothetical protein
MIDPATSRPSWWGTRLGVWTHPPAQTPPLGRIGVVEVCASACCSSFPNPGGNRKRAGHWGLTHRPSRGCTAQRAPAAGGHSGSGPSSSPPPWSWQTVRLAHAAPSRCTSSPPACTPRPAAAVSPPLPCPACVSVSVAGSLSVSEVASFTHSCRVSERLAPLRAVRVPLPIECPSA